VKTVEERGRRVKKIKIKIKKGGVPIISFRRDGQPARTLAWLTS
jgi:hypothetical protein